MDLLAGLNLSDWSTAAEYGVWPHRQSLSSASGVKMDIAKRIYEHVQHVPAPLSQEVMDFTGYLEAKHGLREAQTQALKDAQAPVTDVAWNNSEDEVWDEW